MGLAVILDRHPNQGSIKMKRKSAAQGVVDQLAYYLEHNVIDFAEMWSTVTHVVNNCGWGGDGMETENKVFRKYGDGSTLTVYRPDFL